MNANIGCADLHFLDNQRLPVALQNALTSVLEVMPDDPIQYLGCMYEWEVEKMSYVKQAAQSLLHMHHSHPSFLGHVQKAYIVMSQCPAHKGLRGLTGDVHMDLLHMLTKDVSEKETSRLMERLHCRATEIVPFSIFRTGIYTCLIFKEYVTEASLLYEDLDIMQEGQAKRSVCDAILTHLWDACSAPGKAEANRSPCKDEERQNLRRQLKAEVKALKELPSRTSKTDSLDRKISAQQFLSHAVDIFLLKLQ